MIINIAIADDHPLVINGLKNILPMYPHIRLTGTYANGVALMDGLAVHQPDVLLLDIQLPGKNGDELVPVILKKHPELRILTLTNFDSPLYANTMFTRGAHGYILKTAADELLIAAIEKVYSGEMFVEKAMQEKMEHAAYRVKKAFLSKSELTPREKEVLQLIADGETNIRIGEKLSLSAKTVDNFRTNIMLKLEVNNTAALVKKALLQGLIR